MKMLSGFGIEQITASFPIDRSFPQKFERILRTGIKQITTDTASEFCEREMICSLPFTLILVSVPFKAGELPIKASTIEALSSYPHPCHNRSLSHLAYPAFLGDPGLIDTYSASVEEEGKEHRGIRVIPW
jgi:hypothetical protein